MALAGAIRPPRAAPLAAAALQIFALANAKDPCACLNWKEVYKSDMAMCGESLEYYVAGWSLGYKRREVVNAFAFAGNEAQMCGDFYKKLDSDRCVNVGPFARGTSEWWGGSWCYVSNECNDLYGGRRLSETTSDWKDWLVSFVNDARLSKISEVSWKLCRPGKDPRLRDMEVEELLTLCERQGLSLRSCVKAAYSGSWTHFYWPQIHWMWERRYEPDIFAQLPEILRDAMQKEEAIVVDTAGGGWYSDLVVSRGYDAFYLKYNPKDCPATQYCRSMIEPPQQTPAASDPPQESSAPANPAHAEL